MTMTTTKMKMMKMKMKMICHGLTNGAAFRAKLIAAEPRHFAIGFAGGGISSLLLQLLLDWSYHQWPAVPVIATAAAEALEGCHCAVFANWDLSEKELGILCVGKVIRLILLPCIELLLVLRQAWSVWLRCRHLGHPGRQLYCSV